MGFIDFKNIRVYWLASVAYWGIVLFGYDTCARSPLIHII